MALCLDENEIKTLIEKIALKKISNQDLILSHKILDSVTQVDLIIALETTYNVTISPLELTPENFDTIASIRNLLLKKVNSTG